MSSRATDSKISRKKNRAIIQEQQKRLELFEAQSNKIILDMSDCCLGIRTTAIPENFDWTVKRKLTGHTGYVWSLAISQGGLLLSGSDDRSIKVWYIQTGKCLKTLTGHNNRVESLTRSKEGLLISGSEDKSVKIWDLESGECLKTLHGHRGSVQSLAISNEGLLISGSQDC